MRTPTSLARSDARAARESLAQALRLEPGYLPARYNLAKLERLEGRRDAAARRYRGIVLDEMGQTRGAIGALRRATRKAPRSPDAFLELARVYHRGAQTRQAVAMYQQVLDLDPPAHLAPQLKQAIAELTGR